MSCCLLFLQSKNIFCHLLIFKTNTWHFALLVTNLQMSTHGSFMFRERSTLLCPCTHLACVKIGHFNPLVEWRSLHCTCVQIEYFISYRRGQVLCYDSAHYYGFVRKKTFIVLVLIESTSLHS